MGETGHGRAKHGMGGLGPGEGHNTGRLGPRERHDTDRLGTGRHDTGGLGTSTGTGTSELGTDWAQSDCVRMSRAQAD